MTTDKKHSRTQRLIDTHGLHQLPNEMRAEVINSFVTEPGPRVRPGQELLKRAQVVIRASGIRPGSVVRSSDDGKLAILVSNKSMTQSRLAYLGSETVSDQKLWRQEDGSVQMNYTLVCQTPAGYVHRLCVRPPSGWNKTQREYRDAIRTLLKLEDVLEEQGIEFWRKEAVERNADAPCKPKLAVRS